MGLFDPWSVKEFDIHLSSTTLTPGQMVSGNVVFTVTSEIPFRNVTIKVVGREFTRIETVPSSDERPAAVEYGKRNFFKVHITPLGMPKWGGDWKGTLAPGTYNFPFAVRLPMDALPTMTHYCGNNSAAVQYYVKAKIDIPFSTDSDKVVPFNVVTSMPLAQSLTAAPYPPPLLLISCLCSRARRPCRSSCHLLS